jgi:hypothetical protein
MRLLADHGPFVVPHHSDAEAFWATLADYYLRMTTALTDAPQLAALIRNWLAVPTPGLQQAQQELEQAVMPWVEQTLAAGQRVGAVRSDVPSLLAPPGRCSWSACMRASSWTTTLVIIGLVLASSSAASMLSG